MNDELKVSVLKTMTAAGYDLLAVTSRPCRIQQIGSTVMTFEFKGDITLNVYDGNLQRISVFGNDDHATLALADIPKWLHRDPRSMLESGV